jgi:hypothetical protein
MADLQIDLRSGFGGITFVTGKNPKSDPGAKPGTKDTAAAPLAGSLAFRDWVRADMEYKENGIRPKYS